MLNSGWACAGGTLGRPDSGGEGHSRTRRLVWYQRLFILFLLGFGQCVKALCV